MLGAVVTSGPSHDPGVRAGAEWQSWFHCFLLVVHVPCVCVCGVCMGTYLGGSFHVFRCACICVHMNVEAIGMY